MRKSILLLLLTTAIGTLFLHRYGRSLWFPVYARLTGAQTVAEVVERIRADGIGLDAAFIENLDRLVILGLKEERIIEVWGNSGPSDLVKLKEYPFTGYSGGPGPKLIEGDGQIPEGIYRIEYLNPNSSFHLSMKIDYPNAFDQAKGMADGRSKMGYDIFIHGSSSTIGCIPIGDEAIEELFFLVSEVGQENVTVILSPYDMRTKEQRIEIDAITWEPELYHSIKAAIETLFPDT